MKKIWNTSNPIENGLYICRMDSGFIKTCYWNGDKWREIWNAGLVGIVKEWMDIPYDGEQIEPEYYYKDLKKTRIIPHATPEDLMKLNEGREGNKDIPPVSDNFFRIFYTIFLTIIFFGLQLTMMRDNIWLMITINTILFAGASNSVAKYYNLWKNSRNFK